MQAQTSRRMYKGEVAKVSAQRVPANSDEVAKVSAPALVLAPITLARSASSGRETKRQTDW